MNSREQNVPTLSEKAEVDFVEQGSPGGQGVRSSLNSRALGVPLIPPSVVIDGLVSCTVPKVEMVLQMMGSASDSEFRAAMMLMLGAWGQGPCGTLPMDDQSLCRIADLGRNMDSWLQVKDVALRGWVLCEDQRYHHALVSQYVLEIYLDKSQAAIKGAKGNASRWSLDVEIGEIKETVEHAARSLHRLNPKARVLKSPLIRAILAAEVEVPWAKREEVVQIEFDIDRVLALCRKILKVEDNKGLAESLGERYENVKVWRSRKKLPGRVMEIISQEAGMTVEELMVGLPEEESGGDSPDVPKS